MKVNLSAAVAPQKGFLKALCISTFLTASALSLSAETTNYNKKQASQVSTELLTKNDVNKDSIILAQKTIIEKNEKKTRRTRTRN